MNSGMFGEIKVSLCEDDTTQGWWEHFPGNDTLVTVYYPDPLGTLEDTVLMGRIPASREDSFCIVYEYEAEGVPFLTSDTNPPPYRYLMRVKWNGEWFNYVDDWSVGLLVEHEEMTGTGEDEVEVSLPRAFTFFQNFPNPFNPSTTLSFELGRESCVSLSIYDVRGSLVRELVSGERLRPGRYRFVWHGEDERGMTVPSGIYFSRLVAGEESVTRKMVLLK